MECENLIELEGQYYWYNPAGGCYEPVEITQQSAENGAEVPVQIDESPGRTPSPANSKSASTASSESNEIETGVEAPVQKIAEYSASISSPANVKLSGNTAYSEASTSSNSNKWDEKQTLLLLDLCTTFKNELDNPRVKKMDVYNKISAEMLLKGHQFSWLQCQNRMKTLLTKYKEVKDYNNTSGNSPKNWAYLGHMDAYCGDRPNVTPVQCIGTSSLSLRVENESSLCRNSLKMKTSKIQRKISTSTSPRNKMLTWLQKEAEEAKERERERISVAEKHHQENAHLFKEFLDIMKTKMTDKKP